MSLRFLLLALASSALAHAATPLDEAIALFKEKRYPEARAALEKIATADPTDARACYYLGMTLLRRGDSKAREDALPWLEKAAQLEPRNATYLADYGGTSMLVAEKTRSLGAATKGRDAMEKSLTIDPENIEARVGLWRFYAEAPWPIGSSSKAAAQLAEITKRDPKRAVMVQLDASISAKKFEEAFRRCDELLAKTPDDFFALFQYARVALASGQRLDRGVACLEKYIALASADRSGTANLVLAWVRLGNLHEKRGRADDARTAYQKALELQPGEKTAAAALANLR